eukprot:11202332-Lingulodinium_polyedra.AAC.1
MAPRGTSCASKSWALAAVLDLRSQATCAGVGPTPFLAKRWSNWVQTCRVSSRSRVFVGDAPPGVTTEATEPP